MVGGSGGSAAAVAAAGGHDGAGLGPDDDDLQTLVDPGAVPATAQFGALDYFVRTLTAMGD